MRQRLKKLVQLIAGWALLFLGVIGLFLPVLQGVLFIMLGLILLSWHMPWAERLLSRLRERFPKQHAAMHEWTEKTRRRLHAWWYGEAAKECQGGCPRDPEEK